MAGRVHGPLRVDFPPWPRDRHRALDRARTGLAQTRSGARQPRRGNPHVRDLESARRLDRCSGAGLVETRVGEAPSVAGGIVLGVAFAAYSLAITLFSRDENRAAGSLSATTAIAGMLTFALGAYAFLGDMRIAAGAAVATTALLASREKLHGWVESITWPELRSGVVLLAMTFIALPLVPNEPLGS